MTQKSITFFFGKKRTLSDAADENQPPEEQIASPKRVKTDAPTTSSLSPFTDKKPNTIEQSSPGRLPPTEEEKRTLEQIQQNRLMAKMKLEAKNTFGVVVDMSLSWYKAFESEFSKDYFLKLSAFIAEERTKHIIYPPANMVFSWTRFCQLSEVKVVILGQDPYHQPNQAHGLCFSVRKNVRPPPSLLNMYKELKNDIEGFEIPKHGTLAGWARQGVLLLNACLTVEANKANSHKGKGWEKFTDVVIRYLNDRTSHIVFLLWGKDAQNKGAQINKKRHHVLTCAHPSPLSAHNGFFGCKHFSKSNDYLKSHGITPIDWSNLPSEDDLPFI